MTGYRYELRRLPVNSAGRVIGERHPRAKLSDTQVELILELGFGDPPTPPGRIAEQVQCSRRTVRDILDGRRRVHHVDRYKLVAVRVRILP